MNANEGERVIERLLDTAEEETYAHEKTLHEIYEWAHILNDLLSSLFFVIGSFFFFQQDLQHAGIWLFVAGSLQMMVGPMIRTANKLHVKRIRKEVIHW